MDRGTTSQVHRRDIQCKVGCNTKCGVIVQTKHLIFYPDSLGYSKLEGQQ